METLEKSSAISDVGRKDSIDEKASTTDDRSVDTENIGDVWDDQTPAGKEQIIGKLH